MDFEIGSLISLYRKFNTSRKIVQYLRQEIDQVLLLNIINGAICVRVHKVGGQCLRKEYSSLTRKLKTAWRRARTHVTTCFAKAMPAALRLPPRRRRS